MQFVRDGALLLLALVSVVGAIALLALGMSTKKPNAKKKYYTLVGLMVALAGGLAIFDSLQRRRAGRVRPNAISSSFPRTPSIDPTALFASA